MITTSSRSTRFAKEHGKYEYEFWVTDSSGKVSLGSQGVEFTFKPEQPQAGVFLRLLDGHSNHTEVVVQESRRREIDSSIYKYVAVSGVDMPRIVEVRATGPTRCWPSSPGRIRCWQGGLRDFCCSRACWLTVYSAAW